MPSPRIDPRLAACLAVVGLVQCIGNAGAEPPRTPAEYLRRMDADRDGRISLDEYIASMIGTFDLLDGNHDGVLAGDELPPGAKPITRTAYRQSLAAAFARQDSNHDGFLDARELAQPPR